MLTGFKNTVCAPCSCLDGIDVINLINQHYSSITIDISRKDLIRKNLNENLNITDFEVLRLLALDRKKCNKLENI